MITISLAGLMGVQLFLLNMAWEMKDQAFERNVITALTISAQKLEFGEIAGDALDIIYQFELSDTLQTYNQRMKFITSEEITFPDEMPIELPDSSFDGQQLTVFMSDNRSELIHRVVDGLIVKPLKPINERLNQAEIDSVLRSNLSDVGIDLVPEIYVYTSSNDSLVIFSSNADSEMEVSQLRSAPFRSRLFPLDRSTETFELVLLFPGQRNFLIKQVLPLFAASMIFISVIIAAFVFIISSSAKQRRFAGGIVDFINNMTHEFKTPISTVALASEALSRSDILEQPEALQRYNRMIKDENQRMREQVERILQIAQLETGDYKLNMAPVQMHDILESNSESFGLQLEKLNGNLDLRLQAVQSNVLGDQVHLTNVIANLLDNAIKYSPNSPKIELSTRNVANSLIIEVVDQGIGVAKQDRERIFEKYFRCSTGDRHDVKGFGLGLCYVRLLVEAHGGHVKLIDPKGNGTHVVVNLPLSSYTQRTGSLK